MTTLTLQQAYDACQTNKTAWLNRKAELTAAEQEYQEWNSPSAAVYKDILPTDLYYVEEENEVLTLDKWLSLCDRIQMPVPDDRHSGEMIKDYVKSKLANG